jgi:hypothetical protein
MLIYPSCRLFVVLVKSCILFYNRVAYDVEKEMPSQELWVSTFEKRKITNCLSSVLKQRQAPVHITPLRDFTL